MQDLYRQYRDRASFLTIYVKEAHPTDEWQMDSNEEEGVCYPQPVTLDDRVAIARDFVESCAYEIPIAIDPPDNPANELYAGWPERFYIVDETGTIAYKGKTGPFGYYPEEVAAWLVKRFPPAVALPSEVSAERIAKEPLSVRAVEYADSHERWRITIDPSSRATIGRGSSSRSFQLDPDDALALRRAIAEEGFFSWKEASCLPSVEGRTRSIVIGLGDTSKVVTLYSVYVYEGEDSTSVKRFEKLWEQLRGLDPGP